MRAKKGRLVLVVYAVFLIGWLLQGIGLWLYDSRLEHRSLPLESAGAVGMEALGGGAYLTLDGDPQLHFTGLNTPVRRVRLVAAYTIDLGETDVYYTRREGQGFSAKKRVFGYQQEDGSYLYTLPPGRVQNLRLDPGGRAWNEIQFTSVEINPPQPFAGYLVPNLGTVLALGVLPALAAAWIYIIIEAAGRLRRRRNGGQNDG